MWQLSCYQPNKSRGLVPGLVDVSPEEIRHIAYTAQKENKFDQYVSICISSHIMP